MDSVLSKTEYDRQYYKAKRQDGYISKRDRIIDSRRSRPKPYVLLQTYGTRKLESGYNRYRENHLSSHKNRLAYSKLWVYCRSCVTGPCCLAVLVGAMKHGLSCLHPRLQDGSGRFKVSCALKADFNGMYTLCGRIRTKKIN